MKKFFFLAVFSLVSFIVPVASALDHDQHELKFTVLEKKNIKSDVIFVAENSGVYLDVSILETGYLEDLRCEDSICNSGILSEQFCLILVKSDPVETNFCYCPYLMNYKYQRSNQEPDPGSINKSKV